MKTWEIVKELMENPHKKFKAKWVSGSKIVAYVKERHGITDGCYEDVIVVEFCNGNIEILVISKLTKKMEWTEVKEPVDFMTAMEATKEGSKVRVEHEYISEPYQIDQFSRGFKWLGEIFEVLGRDWEDDEIAEIILNGKWYIE